MSDDFAQQVWIESRLGCQMQPMLSLIQCDNGRGDMQGPRNADDDPIERRMLQQGLSKPDLAIETFPDGEAALCSPGMGDRAGRCHRGLALRPLPTR